MLSAPCPRSIRPRPFSQRFSDSMYKPRHQWVAYHVGTAVSMTFGALAAVHLGGRDFENNSISTSEESTTEADHAFPTRTAYRKIALRTRSKKEAALDEYIDEVPSHAGPIPKDGNSKNRNQIERVWSQVKTDDLSHSLPKKIINHPETGAPKLSPMKKNFSHSLPDINKQVGKNSSTLKRNKPDTSTFSLRDPFKGIRQGFQRFGHWMIKKCRRKPVTLPLQTKRTAVFYSLPSIKKTPDTDAPTPSPINRKTLLKSQPGIKETPDTDAPTPSPINRKTLLEAQPGIKKTPDTDAPTPNHQGQDTVSPSAALDSYNPEIPVRSDYLTYLAELANARPSSSNATSVKKSPETNVWHVFDDTASEDLVQPGVTLKNNAKRPIVLMGMLKPGVTQKDIADAANVDVRTIKVVRKNPSDQHAKTPQVISIS